MSLCWFSSRVCADENHGHFTAPRPASHSGKGLHGFHVAPCACGRPPGARAHVWIEGRRLFEPIHVLQRSTRFDGGEATAGQGEQTVGKCFRGSTLGWKQYQKSIKQKHDTEKNMWNPQNSPPIGTRVNGGVPTSSVNTAFKQSAVRVSQARGWFFKPTLPTHTPGCPKQRPEGRCKGR